MAKYAKCDNCGATDDWSSNGIPFLYGGALIQLRSQGGGDDFERTIELCESCREEIFEKFPKLVEKEE